MNIPILAYPITNLEKAWNRFWFQEYSSKPLNLFRIFFGILLIQYALFLVPDLFIWFGKNGIVSSDTINNWQPYIRLNLLNFFPHSDIWLFIVFVFFIAASICVTLGFMTRISVIIAFLCLVSFHARNYLIINSGDNLMRLYCLWLIFSPAGLTLSLDNWLKNRKEKATNSGNIYAEPWAQRLMQINMALVYAHTFFKKIVGVDWLSGTAVYYSSHLTEMHHLPIPFIFDNLLICQLLTWFTLIIEFSLFSLIWFKPIRYYVIAAGIIMHLIIDWSMNIPQFQWLMITSYILFIEPEDLDKVFYFYRNLYQTLIKKLQFN